MTGLAIELMERGILPDWLTCVGIRKLLRDRLHSLDRAKTDSLSQKKIEQAGYVEIPIAVETEQANKQHYEVPAAFFEAILGKRLKYSSCFWEKDCTSLDQAEERMLAISCERAGIADGMNVLELGCGWGSLSLWIAERYRNCRILAMSNSNSQREHIAAKATALGLRNVEVRTANINDFQPGRRFDRVVSVEMFEHIRNHNELFARISNWLESTGKLFVHVFCHRQFSYPFETEGDDNWMGKYFFTGGMMPSKEMLVRCQDHLALRQSWEVNGTHYQKTLMAWLAKLDANKRAIVRIFQDCYGPANAARWVQRWRVFLLACAELFGFRNGAEWFVAHYLFEQPSASGARQA